MKHHLLRLVATVFLVSAVWAGSALACDGKAKTAAAAQAKSATCTASMAAQCTPAQAAACKAKGAHAASAANADAAVCCAAKSGAAAVAAHGACSSARSAAHAACKAKGANAAAAHAACKARGADAATALAVESNAPDAYPAGGGTCGGRGIVSAVEDLHGADCDACADMALCNRELRALGSVTQVVKLKNGIMVVNTASNPGDVRAVQSAIGRRNQRLNAIAAAGDKAHLCADCRAMRGAMASGKLIREMVAIEGGCLTLMTSEDPEIVDQLHALAAPQTAARIKS